MTRLPTAYSWAVALAGAVSAVLVAGSLVPPAAWVLAFAGLTGCAIVAQLFMVVFPTGPPVADGAGEQRPFAAFLFAGVLLLPPGPFVLLALIPHLVAWVQEQWGSRAGRRPMAPRPVAHHFFSTATDVIAGIGAGWLYRALLAETWTRISPLPLFAILSAVAAYVVIQRVLRGEGAVLAQGQSWSETGALAPANLLPDVLTCWLGGVVAVLWNGNAWFILLALSPLALTGRALQVPRLTKEAQTDVKTGLLNARAFNELFTAELNRARRFDRPLALIMADLDLLRNINNTYGHLAGDRVLTDLGRVIRESTRDFDITARFGGEEFAIALPETQAMEAGAIAERLRLAVTQRCFALAPELSPIPVTMSLGLALFPGDGVTSTDLIHAADVALYQAKLKGRNCVVCASDVPRSVGAAMGGPPPEPRGSPDATAPSTRHLLPTRGAEPADTAATPGHAAPAPADAPSARDRFVAYPESWLRVFVGAVIAAGVAVTLLGLTRGHAADLTAIGVLSALTAILELLQVNVYGDNTASVTVATIFAAALISGIPGAAAVSATIALTHFVRMRPALYKTAFNWAIHLLAATVPVFVMQILGNVLQVTNLPVLAIPIAIAALAFFVLDTGLLACAIGLSTGNRILALWRNQFQWLGPHYLVLGIIGLFLAIAYGALGPAGVLVFTLPILMMRQVQQQYVERTKESMQELKRLNNELAEANREVVTASHAVQQLNDELFLALSKILDARDPYVGNHAAQVATYASAIARELGLSPQRVEIARQAGYVHDIGKIAISEQVLHKPGPLTAREYAYVQTHAAIGADWLESSQALRHLAPFVRSHHERWDGGGYPAGLVGGQIPLEGRILGLCDAVEAMASDRPYHLGMSVEAITAEVQRCAGTHFDPHVVETFVRIVRREGSGFIVNSAREITRQRLGHDDRLGGTGHVDRERPVPAGVGVHVERGAGEQARHGERGGRTGGDVRAQQVVARGGVGKREGHGAGGIMTRRTGGDSRHKGPPDPA